MYWRDHLYVATAALSRGFITEAIFREIVEALAVKGSYTADELWLRPGRVTTAQFAELMRGRVGAAPATRMHNAGPSSEVDSGAESPFFFPVPLEGAEPAERAKPRPNEQLAPSFGTRFIAKSSLGFGGMGQVFECEDVELNRRVAVKAIRSDLVKVKGMTESLQREARLTALLEHPNIVPIYGAGSTPAAGPFYAMRVITQPSLAAVLHRLRNKDAHAEREYGMGRLLRTFIQVCHAVGYAHDRGVIHCDLKPGNVLLGDYGEVLVVDWGLALSNDDEKGAMGGTPGYMPPEQYSRDRARIDARSDVFALGAILYETICLMRTPQRPTSALTPPSTLAPTRGGPELDEICITALALDPGQRYQSARELAGAIEAFLEGTKEKERRERRAADDVETGEMLAQGYFEMLDTRPERIAEVEAIRTAIAPHEGIERKRELWDAEDRVAVTDRIAVSTMQGAIAAYEHALDEVPNHPGAMRGLHELYARELHRARVRRNDLDRAFFEELVRRHAPLAGDDPNADGVVVLDGVNPPQVVGVHRFAAVDRRLVAKEVSSTAAVESALRATLAPGSYVAIVEHDGRATRYPFLVASAEELTVAVEPALAASAAPGEVFIPGGPALLGVGGELAKVEVPSFYIDQFPVTFASYQTFLAERFDADGAKAEAHVPRGDDGEPYLSWDGHKLAPTRAGVLGASLQQTAMCPVFGITLASAEEYAAWQAARTGLPYRLPTDAEWEKAARGVDGRRYPWGDAFDATFCKMRQSRAGRPRPEPVGAFAIDESPYGVRDMAGGITEWTALGPAMAAGGPVDRVLVKGGAWSSWPSDCDLGAPRLYWWTTEHSVGVGFRLARTA